MNPVRLLVTGAGGLLGEEIASVAAKHFDLRLHFHHQPDHFDPDTSFCGDLANRNHLESIAGKFRPHIIINCAALSDVDACETDPERSFRANIDAVKNLLDVFPAAHLIQLSTDYVFSEMDHRPLPYDEPIPLCVYGRHKLEAERLVLERSPESLIVRTNTMFGDPDKRNFLQV